MEAELTIEEDAAPGPHHARSRQRGPGPPRDRTATAASARTTSASSTPAARAARTGVASARSSASTRRFRRSARATTAASAPASSSATPTPRPSRCSASRGRRDPRRAARRAARDPALAGLRPPGPRDANIDRCWTCRAMFVQAWGHYGTAWPVVRQQLGVRPDMGRRRLEVTPQVPQGQSRVAGSNIRLAGGAVDVAASRAGGTYRTERQARRGALALRDRPHAAARLARQAASGSTAAARATDPRSRTAASRCWCAPRDAAARSS